MLHRATQSPRISSLGAADLSTPGLARLWLIAQHMETRLRARQRVFRRSKAGGSFLESAMWICSTRGPRRFQANMRFYHRLRDEIKLELQVAIQFIQHIGRKSQYPVIPEVVIGN